jgi:phenylpyruvate tautomerase PptA (4-oxalocrotonate tautomerase family)
LPNIFVHIPQSSFPGTGRDALVQRINDAAAEVEQIGPAQRQRFLCWVLINEVPAGAWTCGGSDVTKQALPCLAFVMLPAGVLDAATRGRYAALLHQAFVQSMPAADTRVVTSSVLLHDVADGTWGANGALWTLRDFASAAGYQHLQHLVGAAHAR